MHDKNAMVPGAGIEPAIPLPIFHLQGDADRAQGVDGQALDKFQ